MSEAPWFVRRFRPFTYVSGGATEYLVLDGPFAYPRWSTAYATALGKSEAHQHAMGFGSPHYPTTQHLALQLGPATVADAPKLLPKWRPKSSKELEAESASGIPSVGG